MPGERTHNCAMCKTSSPRPAGNGKLIAVPLKTPCSIVRVSSGNRWRLRRVTSRMRGLPPGWQCFPRGKEAWGSSCCTSCPLLELWMLRAFLHGPDLARSAPRLSPWRRCPRLSGGAAPPCHGPEDILQMFAHRPGRSVWIVASNGPGDGRVILDRLQPLAGDAEAAFPTLAE
jgi:hypothetical protein